MLWQSNELALLVAFLVCFLAAIEVGFRGGLRLAGGADDATKAHISALQAALLGLLALLLGFTFFMAAERYDARRALVLEEANAIGTANLRAQFLPTESQQQAKALIRAHLAARIAFFAAGVDAKRVEQANNEAARLEQQLWELAVAAAKVDPASEPIALFVESLNDVIDLQEKRQAALDSHVPEAVLYLLLIVSMVSFAAIGYGCGLAQQPRRGWNALFALLIVFVLTMILDIDRPRRGIITVSQDSLIRLQSTLASEAQ